MSADSYVHRRIPGQPGAPLLFLFHGTGGNEDQLPGLGRELLPAAGLVSPRGDVSEFGAARFFRRTGEGVYDMADLARSTAKMAGFVKAHADAEKPEALIGLGYSNGANILASVLFSAPGLFDAAVLMHPLIPFKPEIGERMGGKHILITAGRRDPICPPDLTEALRGYLQAAGADVTLVWHEGGHEIRPNEIAAARDFLAPWRNREKEERNAG